MSNPTERWFGWHHQVNGSDFYMSVKQVLQAEKKIRKLSLLQHQALMTAAGPFAQYLLPINSNNTQNSTKDLIVFVHCQSGSG